MRDVGYDSPGKAALAGFVEEQCRAVASDVYEDDAYVLLDTGSPGEPYFYGANCCRINGRWFELASSNGSGWHQTGDNPAVGTLSMWDEVGEDVEAVRVSFNGNTSEHPANHRAYLAVWWRVPQPVEWPSIVGYRVGGVWRSAAGVTR